LHFQIKEIEILEVHELSGEVCSLAHLAKAAFSRTRLANVALNRDSFPQRFTDRKGYAHATSYPYPGALLEAT